MDYPFFGRVDYASLNTKAQILLQLGSGDEAMASIEQAMNMTGVNAGQIHQLAHSMIAKLNAGQDVNSLNKT